MKKKAKAYEPIRMSKNEHELNMKKAKRMNQRHCQRQFKRWTNANEHELKRRACGVATRVGQTQMNMS